MTGDIMGKVIIAKEFTYFVNENKDAVKTAIWQVCETSTRTEIVRVYLSKGRLCKDMVSFYKKSDAVGLAAYYKKYDFSKAGKGSAMEFNEMISAFEKQEIETRFERVKNSMFGMKAELQILRGENRSANHATSAVGRGVAWLNKEKSMKVKADKQAAKAAKVAAKAA